MAGKKKETGIINIHGKEYKTVALRVAEFREQHKQKYSLVTEIMKIDDSVVLMRATIFDITGESQKAVATGHAEEYRSASKVNRTSAVENAETSAMGRALANFGLGGTELSICSADEVQHAIVKQETLANNDQVVQITALLNDGTVSEEHLVRAFGHAEVDKLLATEAARILAALATAQNQQRGE